MIAIFAILLLTCTIAVVVLCLRASDPPLEKTGAKPAPRSDDRPDCPHEYLGTTTKCVRCGGRA